MRLCTGTRLGPYEILGSLGAGGMGEVVMEYVEGETLSARLRKDCLPVTQALELAIHIAEALDAAHRRSIDGRRIAHCPTSSPITHSALRHIPPYLNTSGLTRPLHQLHVEYPAHPVHEFAQVFLPDPSLPHRRLLLRQEPRRNPRAGDDVRFLRHALPASLRLPVYAHPSLRTHMLRHRSDASFFNSAGQLTITVSGCPALAGVARTRKRWPSEVAS